MYLQIIIFFIVAAALGFVIGWVLRASREATEATTQDAGTDERLAQVTSERDRLQAELRDAKAAADKPAIPAADPALAAAASEAQHAADAHAARVEKLDGELAAAHRRIGDLEAALQGAKEETDAQRAQIQALESQLTAPAGDSSGGADATEAEGTPPAPIEDPAGEPDNLKKISGIGPSIEKTLHELGIYRFHQIAAFTPDNVAWVNQRLRFKGRIEREDWISQAKQLAAGDDTEFSRRQS